MVRNAQVLGLGPCAVLATSARACSPGPCRNRSSSSSRVSKSPPTRPTLLVAKQPFQSCLPVVVQPAVDCIRVARLQQAVTGDSVGREPIGDFQYRGTALANIGSWIVIAIVQQIRALRISQVQASS